MENQHCDENSISIKFSQSFHKEANHLIQESFFVAQKFFKISFLLIFMLHYVCARIEVDQNVSI